MSQITDPPELKNPFASTDAFEGWGRRIARDGGKEAYEALKHDLGLDTPEAIDNLKYIIQATGSWRKTKNVMWLTFVRVVVTSAAVAFIGWVTHPWWNK